MRFWNSAFFPTEAKEEEEKDVERRWWMIRLKVKLIHSLSLRECRTGLRIETGIEPNPISLSRDDRMNCISVSVTWPKNYIRLYNDVNSTNRWHHVKLSRYVEQKKKLTQPYSDSNSAAKFARKVRYHYMTESVLNTPVWCEDRVEK